jgi:hypothetical protein
VVDGVIVTPVDGVATISWNPEQGSTTFGVLRGLVSQLPVGPGGGDEVCLQDQTQATLLADPDVPAEGASFWYLVRGNNQCGAGSYGVAVDSGLPTTRLSSTCP